MTMTFSTTEIGGLTIRTAQSKSSDRPKVVLTNGLPQSIRCWESHWEGLSERFDLLAVDLPGFGMSEGSGAIMRPSAQADFLAKVFDAFHIDQAFVVGPDVGVPVALSFAADYPNRVLGLNIFDGPGTWPPDFSDVLRLAVRSRLARWMGTVPPMRKRFMDQNYEVATKLGYHHYRPTPEAKAEYRQIADDRVKHANAFVFLGSYGKELPKLEAKLPTIQKPVLITWGAEDHFVFPSNAEKLHQKLPNSEVTIFENAGHFSHEDAGKAWLDRFSVFVEGNLK
ncbi:MAG: alpha/beta hydrolase [Planctomycetota bacterium]|nr:MAG: alpha/beta hydrolase [Planctomycetota bacterium]